MEPSLSGWVTATANTEEKSALNVKRKQHLIATLYSGWWLDSSFSRMATRLSSRWMIITRCCDGEWTHRGHTAHTHHLEKNIFSAQGRRFFSSSFTQFCFVASSFFPIGMQNPGGCCVSLPPSLPPFFSPPLPHPPPPPHIRLKPQLWDMTLQLKTI